MAEADDLLSELAGEVAAAHRLEADAEIARLRSEVANLKLSPQASLSRQSFIVSR